MDTFASYDQKILIVDDHWISAAGLSALLLVVFPGLNCDTCSTVQESIERIGAADSTGRYTLIVADFWLPDGNALALMNALPAGDKASKLIVLSGDSNPELSRKVLNQGAWAFCQKTAPASELVSLIARALAGAPPPPHSPIIKGDAAAQPTTQVISVGASELCITPRQGAVLRLVLAGRANKVIAIELGIKEQTVKEHVTAVLEHFGVKNRVALLRLFADRRLTLEPML